MRFADPRKARHRLVTVGRRDDEDLLVDERRSLPVARQDVHICTRQEVQRRSTVRWLPLEQPSSGVADQQDYRPLGGMPLQPREPRHVGIADDHIEPPGGVFLRNFSILLAVGINSASRQVGTS